MGIEFQQKVQFILFEKTILFFMSCYRELINS